MKNFLLLKISALITGIIIVGFICITVINENTYGEVIRDDIRNISRLTSLNIYAKIDNELTKPIFVSLTMANDSFLKAWLHTEGTPEGRLDGLRRYLRDLERKYGYNSVFLISAKTNNYYHYNGIHKRISPDDAHDVWYYNFLKTGKSYALDVDTDEADHNTLTVFVDCRIEDENGELMGVVGVGVRMDTLQRLLARFEREFSLTAFLVDTRGEVQVHTSDDHIRRKTLFDLLPVEPMRETIFNKAKMESVWYRYDDRENCLVTRYIPDLHWYLIVEKDTSIIKRSFLSQLWKDIIVVSVIILLIIILIGIIIVRYNRRMTRLATTDDLTGLVNRERFNAILSRKTGESPLVFMFDVDNFKSINDTYGHLRGNEVLASVARRARDIVGDAGLVARWGGDEFIGLIDRGVDADTLLARLLSEMRGGEDGITISLGATRTGPGDTLDAILMRADDAMYASKTGGRDRLTFVR